ncbi:MAG: sulfate adenylyltransferase, partial [Thermoplasmata archaeon]
MLPPPPGGRLIERVLSESDRARRDGEVAELPRIHPFEDELFDLEKIAVGAYSPLQGFMGSEEIEAVLAGGRLPDGLPFSLPILLAPRDPRDRPTLE